MHPGANGAELRGVDVSIIAPAHNERENVDALVAEVEAAMAAWSARTGRRWEFVVVDDGSTDGTGDALARLRAGRPWLRVVRMSRTPPGQGAGQSAAFWAGIRAARGELIATLDADLQNDPAEIPALLDWLDRHGADLVQGDRSRARRDPVVRRAGSVVGRVFRRALLGDPIRDTGCSLRVMKRHVALSLPLEYRGMHRFIPVTARRMGFVVIERPVTHRARLAGTTKYGFGITQRALPGLRDCFAVRWMFSRRRWTDWAELEALASAEEIPAERTGAGAP